MRIEIDCQNLDEAAVIIDDMRKDEQLEEIISETEVGS